MKQLLLKKLLELLMHNMDEINTEAILKKPIFVFSCRNSGSTILWEALKTHRDLSGPEVEGQDLEELPDSMKHHLGNATFRLWAHPKFKLCYYKTENDYNLQDKEKIINVYRDNLIPGTRFITKSPADTLRARLIQSYFPDAHFIAIVRNGYAVSEGIVRKRKLDLDRPQFKGLYTTIDEAAEQWFRSNVIIASHKKFLENYKVIKYEDLIDNSHDTLLSVLDFCNLSHVDFQVPSFKDNLNYEQISRLSGYDLETVTRIAQPMLLHFDYKIINPNLGWENV